MKDYAEYVSRAHPDRLGDQIVERLVDIAAERDERAFAQFECALFKDECYLTGRIAAGKGEDPLPPSLVESAVRETFREAGFGKECPPDPESVRIIDRIQRDPLEEEEKEGRPYADDQCVVVGYAEGTGETSYMPLAHYLANYLGRRLEERFRLSPLGPDFKLLAVLEEEGWGKLILSAQERGQSSSRTNLELAYQAVQEALRSLPGGRMDALKELPLSRFFFNRGMPFREGGPYGDNGLSGKKLAVDFYGPGVPLGGGAICGKDFWKPDVAGSFAARREAIRLLKETGAWSVLLKASYCPGERKPVALSCEMMDEFGTKAAIPSERIGPSALDIKKTAERLLSRKARKLDLLKRGYFFDDVNI